MLPAASAQAMQLTDEEVDAALADKIANAAPIGTGVAIILVLLGLILAMARGVSPSADPRPLLIGAVGVVLGLLVDIAADRRRLTSPGVTVADPGDPVGRWRSTAVATAPGGWRKNELMRVVFPPLVLIVAVLGSILGGITNPTPAAALGAGGAIMLAAYRKLKDEERLGQDHHLATLRDHDHDPGRA